MTERELMQIRLARQHLTDKTDRRTVVRDLLGVQAQFMVNALHSLHIRCRESFSDAEAGEGLVKNWTVRGTVHVFDEADLGLFRHDPALYRSMNFRGYGYFDEKRLYWGLQKPYGDEIRRAWEKDGCVWTLTPERQRHWSEVILRQVAEGTVMMPKECTCCPKKNRCAVCAAVCFAETGSSDVRPEYICRMTREYDRLLCEKYKKTENNL